MTFELLCRSLVRFGSSLPGETSLMQARAHGQALYIIWNCIDSLIILLTLSIDVGNVAFRDLW
jgi:hypothetical protein